MATMQYMMSHHGTRTTRKSIYQPLVQITLYVNVQHGNMLLTYYYTYFVAPDNQIITLFFQYCTQQSGRTSLNSVGMFKHCKTCQIAYRRGYTKFPQIIKWIKT